MTYPHPTIDDIHTKHNNSISITCDLSTPNNQRHTHKAQPDIYNISVFWVLYFRVKNFECFSGGINTLLNILCYLCKYEGDYIFKMDPTFYVRRACEIRRVVRVKSTSNLGKYDFEKYIYSLIIWSIFRMFSPLHL